MATNQNVEFVQLLYAWQRTLSTQQTFIKKFCQHTCSDIAMKTYMYFHFSHYKSMETLPEATKAHEQRQ